MSITKNISTSPNFNSLKNKFKINKQLKTEPNQFFKTKPQVFGYFKYLIFGIIELSIFFAIGFFVFLTWKLYLVDKGTFIKLVNPQFKNLKILLGTTAGILFFFLLFYNFFYGILIIQNTLLFLVTSFFIITSFKIEYSIAVLFQIFALTLLGIILQLKIFRFLTNFIKSRTSLKLYFYQNWRFFIHNLSSYFVIYGIAMSFILFILSYNFFSGEVPNSSNSAENRWLNHLMNMIRFFSQPYFFTFMIFFAFLSFWAFVIQGIFFMAILFILAIFLSPETKIWINRFQFFINRSRKWFIKFYFLIRFESWLIKYLIKNFWLIVFLISFFLCIFWTVLLINPATVPYFKKISFFEVPNSSITEKIPTSSKLLFFITFIFGSIFLVFYFFSRFGMKGLLLFIINWATKINLIFLISLGINSIDIVNKIFFFFVFISFYDLIILNQILMIGARKKSKDDSDSITFFHFFTNHEFDFYFFLLILICLSFFIGFVFITVSTTPFFIIPILFFIFSLIFLNVFLISFYYRCNKILIWISSLITSRFKKLPKKYQAEEIVVGVND